MCGRYGSRADRQRIAEWMQQTHNTDVFDDSYLAPSYKRAQDAVFPVELPSFGITPSIV